MNDEPININIELGNNSHISNSGIGNVNIFQNKSTKRLFEDIIVELRGEINNIQETDIKRKLLCKLTFVEKYFNKHSNILGPLLKQVNCNQEKSQENIYESLFKIISFFLIALYFDEQTKLPDADTQKTIVNSLNHWIFNTARTNVISLELQFSKIADYLASNPDSEIINGVCFITKILNNGGLDCKKCINGCFVAMNKYYKILPDWMKTDTQSNLNFSNLQNVKDFFDLQYEKNITFKCGQCITNINQLENAEKILLWEVQSDWVW